MSELVSKNDLPLNQIQCQYCLQRAVRVIAVCSDCAPNGLTLSSTHIRSTNRCDVRPINAVNAVNGSNGMSCPSDSHRLDMDLNDLLSTHLPIKSSVNYVLFGTYMTDCRSLELSEECLKLTAISPNILGVKFKYNITVPFSDIRRLSYCLEPTLLMVFIETTEQSNQMIKISMNLGNNSKNGLKYDINSDDLIERYIVLDLKPSLDQNFIQVFQQVLSRCPQVVTNELIFKKMSTDNAIKFVRQVKSKFKSVLNSKQII